MKRSKDVSKFDALYAAFEGHFFNYAEDIYIKFWISLVVIAHTVSGLYFFVSV